MSADSWWLRVCATGTDTSVRDFERAVIENPASIVGYWGDPPRPYGRLDLLDGDASYTFKVHSSDECPFETLRCASRHHSGLFIYCDWLHESGDYGITAFHHGYVMLEKEATWFDAAAWTLEELVDELKVAIEESEISDLAACWDFGYICASPLQSLNRSRRADTEQGTKLLAPATTRSRGGAQWICGR